MVVVVVVVVVVVIDWSDDNIKEAVDGARRRCSRGVMVGRHVHDRLPRAISVGRLTCQT